MRGGPRTDVMPSAHGDHSGSREPSQTVKHSLFTICEVAGRARTRGGCEGSENPPPVLATGLHPRRARA